MPEELTLAYPFKFFGSSVLITNFFYLSKETVMLNLLLLVCQWPQICLPHLKAVDLKMTSATFVGTVASEHPTQH